MRNAKTQRRATELRRAATDAEQHLWYFLRRRNLSSCRFRRQVPIGPYILDFLCIEAGLAIEIDGSQHVCAHEYDQRRERFLAEHGIRVLRFWNNEVLQQTEAVLQIVLTALTARAAAKMPPS